MTDIPEELTDAGNLDNIKNEYNLFGEELPQLGVMDRVGFAPISIWKPDWNVTKKLKEWVGDDLFSMLEMRIKLTADEFGKL